MPRVLYTSFAVHFATLKVRLLPPLLLPCVSVGVAATAATSCCCCCCLCCCCCCCCCMCVRNIMRRAQHTQIYGVYVYMYIRWREWSKGERRGVSRYIHTIPSIKRRMPRLRCDDVAAVLLPLMMLLLLLLLLLRRLVVVVVGHFIIDKQQEQEQEQQHQQQQQQRHRLLAKTKQRTRTSADKKDDLCPVCTCSALTPLSLSAAQL